jgi:hypothetical protein
VSINPIGTGQAPSTQQVTQLLGHRHGHSGMHKAGMDAAAQALGLSTSDLQAALKRGQTLTSLAKATGVSLENLGSAISAALTKANPSLSSDRAQQIAQRMISGPESNGTGVRQTAQLTDGDKDGDAR